MFIPPYASKGDRRVDKPSLKVTDILFEKNLTGFSKFVLLYFVNSLSDNFSLCTAEIKLNIFRFI